MKPWSEYESIVYKFDSKNYIEERTKEIDELPLTTEERKCLLAEMYKYSRAETEKADKLTKTLAFENIERFFEDCRAELGYTKFLSDKGRVVLEDAAIENSGTLEGVYNYLKDCLNASGV